MKVFSIETVQNSYTTYTVSAENEEEAKQKLLDTFVGRKQDRESSDILTQSFPSGYDDNEEIIQVTKIGEIQ